MSDRPPTPVPGATPRYDDDGREPRARVIYDPEPDWSYLEQDVFGWDGETFGAFGPIVDGVEYGSLAVVAEALCPCCDRWESLSASLWGIDVAADDRSLIGVPYEGDPMTPLVRPDVEGGTYAAEELRAWLVTSSPGQGRHHLAEVALEVLEEARDEL